MAAQRDLAKLGSEGFALIDEYFGKKWIVNRPRTTVAHNMAASISTTFLATQQSCNYHYSSAETHVYQVNPSVRREAMITGPTPAVALSSYEAAQLHDDIYLASYFNRRQMRMTY
ncbi:hypothetical protein KY290_001448 [Solanum tuberosum]|uniref:Uncharacterized protein n=2 Tax=Solanum tuberosum TaxID=4113 RepID=A0ABQ7WMP6_SOLTU|nr:hypothetical protein KY289_004203 [Solanum tuberosum]KAH0781850.1 hypothetical protein KY290_001448 [Solanum tuberosum]